MIFKKRFPIIILFLICSIHSFGQEKICDTCRSVSISICPTEMVAGYETVYLDYLVSKHFSLAIGAGHIFPNVIIDKIVYADDPMWVAYNGTVIRLEVKYFLENSNGAYIGLMATYKDLFYSWHSFFHFNGDDGEWVFHQSESSYVFGESIIYGKQHKFSKHGKIDIFLGLGLNRRSGNYTVHDYTGKWDVTYYGTMGDKHSRDIGTHSENNLFPTLRVGCKFGLNY
jgi:hypothetical protein